MPISSITWEMVITAHDDYVEKKTFSAQLMILEVFIERGSAAVSYGANRTKTVCRTVEHMNSFLLKSIT